MDERVFARLSSTRSGALDASMPRLSTAADHSILWFGIAAALGLLGGRAGRRAALRGVIAIGGASVLSSGILKRLLPRRRPSAEAFPFVGLRHRYELPQPGSAAA